MTAEELFEAVAHAMVDDGATRTRMFGAPGLKVGGKFFACLYRGQLVFKLPRDRVDALAAAGHGERFDPGMGRQMKEWIALRPEVDQDWQLLASEARDFVAGTRE